MVHAAGGIWEFLTLALWLRPLKFWVFVASITNEFIFRMDIHRAQDASLDLGRGMLRPEREEV